LRDAFCSHISSFMDDHILCSIFAGDPDKSKEQRILNTVQHGMTFADNPHILETSMKCTAEIILSVDLGSKLFLFSLILLVDQLDSKHVSARMNASRLIHKYCNFHLKGGLKLILSKDVHICNNSDYHSKRLGSRLVLVRGVCRSCFWC